MATQAKVLPLLLGEADVSKQLDVMWSLSREREVITVPILGFAILVNDQVLVVDTGFRDAERCTTVQHLGPHRTRPEWSVTNQLARWGIAPHQVAMVVLTHLHYDHAGGLGAFPNAQIVVQRLEVQAAAVPIVSRALGVGGHALFYDRLDVADVVSTYWDRLVLLEGDEEIAPGVRCVLYANSHTPGTQVVYVDTVDGRIALLGDLARNVHLNVEEELVPGIYYDLESTRRALRDVKRSADLYVPAHDYSVMHLLDNR